MQKNIVFSTDKWTSPISWKIESWPTKRTPSFTDAELEAAFESVFSVRIMCIPIFKRCPREYCECN